jgi:hypothetical protein
VGCDITEKGGIVTIACSRGRRTPKKCTFPNCDQPGDRLCDFPTGNGKTCDRRGCRRHLAPAGPNKDYCITHPREFEKEK